MSIINVTPDSFSSGSRADSPSAVVEKARLHLSQGADIIDIGGCSTRPGGEPVSAAEERRRVMPALEALRANFKESLISLDTFRSDIAAEAIDKYDVNIINDISGGEWDKEMFDVVGSRHTAYVLSYMPHTKDERFKPFNGRDMVADMQRFFTERTERLRSLGTEHVIIDPGFGFCKTIEQNYELLARLGELKKENCRLLVGISRKSMIYKPLGSTPEQALNGTTALNMAALINGADILRVHDTAEAREVIILYDHLYKRHS